MASPNTQLSWGLSTTLTSSSQVQKPIQRTQSPTPRLIGEGSSTPSDAVPPPVVMTKEEKALEMTRRKEERKQVCFKQSRGKISSYMFQRIAILKEQKKAATKT